MQTASGISPARFASVAFRMKFLSFYVLRDFCLSLCVNPLLRLVVELYKPVSKMAQSDPLICLNFLEYRAGCKLSHVTDPTIPAVKVVDRGSRCVSESVFISS